MADLVTEAELVAARPDLAGNPDLPALIAAATAAIEGFCGRPLALGTYSDAFTLDYPTRAVWLRVAPVASITSVAIDGLAVDPSGYTLISPATGELARGGPCSRNAWPPGARRLTVTYTAGYDPIPADLKRAAIAWVVDATQAPGRITSERIGDYQYTLAGDGPSVRPFVASLLRRYRRVRITSGD